MLIQLDKEKMDIDKRYDEIYNNGNLTQCNLDMDIINKEEGISMNEDKMYEMLMSIMQDLAVVKSK